MCFNPRRRARFRFHLTQSSSHKSASPTGARLTMSRIYVSNSCGHAFMASRRNSPERCDRPALRRPRGRRECRALAATHGPPANKMQAAGTTGPAEHPAFPARRFSRLYAVSLVRRAFWPPYPREAKLRRVSDNALTRVAPDTSIGVSGRCDFTSAWPAVRPRASTLPAASRPSPPRLACRDDRAQRPSSMRRDADIMHDFGKKERRFLRRSGPARRFGLKFRTK